MNSDPNAASQSTLCLPFANRKEEMARLEIFARDRRHVLLTGCEGIGKTALARRMKEILGMVVSSKSEHFGSICDDLEAQLGLADDGFKLPARKARVLQILQAYPRIVVFDSVKWVTPKLSSFLETVMNCVPVWICTRSAHPWDIGHIWPLLVRFEKLALSPFHSIETEHLIRQAVTKKCIPSETEAITNWLHQKSKGVPGLLRRLLAEVAAGDYDLNNPQSLKRLELDAHIHAVFPNATLGTQPTLAHG